ncbi:MAG: beta-ketoacyl-ACP synthase II, partial [Xanthomonadales bacterium]|nr:beta-ketoacyl-ACP synthase II [Xanthomonadales bacterium]NIN59436.1 beta-ketoacyl-ACP synthase II [Xanthomonadales bacterium]NIN74810.1 beta-ketoacyl-ACP synthase II [Xanthomonadales bacterium]NIO12637.1 beta-ketoacyl-ACP synthase II [Xanthomonadales bacterium]NIP11829.1 beta-ketoacyl-ACP synthase II [Xanthomonadales bacterium]
MSARRTVITGMGIVSPVGSDIDTAWEAVCNGRSGIGPITSFDASNLSTQIAGEVRGFDVEAYLSPKEARKNDQFIHFGMAASIQALRDAGLEDGSAALDPERVGCSLGAGIGGIATIESTTESYLKGGPRKVSPFFIPGTIVNMIGGN